MKKLMLVISLVYPVLHVVSQPVARLTIQQCIDSALRKNIPLQQSRLAKDVSNVNVNLAKAVQMPTVYGNVGQGVNFGRNVDPFTNDYVNQTIGYGSYGVAGEVVIYNGKNIQNNIRGAQSAAVAANHDLRLVRQQTVLNVIT